ncbi:hypothetical protein [Vibrio phage LP.1]|nr:hypothetical protein [Vibrio phage LP.1]
MHINIQRQMVNAPMEATVEDARDAVKMGGNVITCTRTQMTANYMVSSYHCAMVAMGNMIKAQFKPDETIPASYMQFLVRNGLE